MQKASYSIKFELVYPAAGGMGGAGPCVFETMSGGGEGANMMGGMPLY
jgi:hypothetical protein